MQTHQTSNSQQPCHDTEARNQITEWGTEHGWWAGPYDFALISDDHDLHAFDINLNQFTKEGKSIVNKYLPKFQVTINKRKCYNGERH